MQGELYAALDRISTDPEARVVVLTGAGRGFCGGADMSVLQVASAETESGSRPLLAPMWFPKPIIAAINGPCAGIGLQLALMCDVRIAAKRQVHDLLRPSWSDRRARAVLAAPQDHQHGHG